MKDVKLYSIFILQKLCISSLHKKYLNVLLYHNTLKINNINIKQQESQNTKSSLKFEPY